MKKLLWLLLLASAFAQAPPPFMNVTASSIYGTGGNLLPAGTMIWQAVDGTGAPISYQVGGGGQQISFPTVCTITTGALIAPCRVANTSITNPLNVCFSVTIKDSGNKIVLGGPQSGYTCAQPQTSNFWCSSGSCNFDQFIPNLPGAILAKLPPPSANALGGIYADTCPVGQAADAVQTTGHIHCSPGAGGGSSVWGGITGTLSNQTDLAAALALLAPLSSPALTGTPTAPTPSTADNSTRIQTTAGVKALGYAPLNSPTFTGTPTAPTPPLNANNTDLVTAAWVLGQGFSTGSGNVSGPNSSTVGDIAIFNATNGRVINDVGFGFPLDPTHIGTLVAGSNGLAASATTDTTNASNIATGTLGHARLPALVSGDIPNNAANTSGNAATSTALAAAPSLCPSGQSAQGILANGNATGCGTNGLADPGSNGILKRTALNTTAIAVTNDINTALGYNAANDSTVLHSAGAETVSGVKTFTTNVIVSSIQNRLSNYLALISAPSGSSPPGTLILDASNGYLQIQADSGAGANQGGVLNVQSSNGPNAAALASLTVGSNGVQVTATTTTLFAAVGLKTILTGPGTVQIGNTGGTAGSLNWVGNTSGTKTIACSDATCTNLAITGPVTISGTALGAASGGTGVTDFTFSGSTHKAGTVSGTLTSGNCVQFDASGNLISAGAPCGAGGSVASVFGRTGAITAQSGDYSVGQVTGAATDSLVVHLAGTETVTGSKTFSALISGTISAAQALAATPTLCSSGQAAQGVLTSGNATGCQAIPVASATTPIVDGTGTPGVLTTYARGDHVHPTDTSRAADSSVVHLAGIETVTGAKTFSSLITGSVSGNAGTATALAGTPTLCSAGQAARGILASGNATGCFATVTLAGDLGNTGATPWVLSTHITGGTINTLPKFDATANLIPSSATDDGTTYTITASGGLTIAPGTAAAGYDGLAYGTDTAVVANTIGLMAGAAGTGYNFYFPNGPATGFLFGTNTSGKVQATFQSAIDLTSNVGATILPVANGGTGLNTITPVHGVMVAEGTSSPHVVAVAPTGYVLASVGGADPAWAATLSLGSTATSGTFTPTTGSIGLTGSTSGNAVTLTVGAATAAYSISFPVAAGTTGGPLLYGTPTTWGTRSGNTTVFGTTSGTLTSGNCAKFDANGNIVDNGAACGSGGGGGVNTGTADQIAYYASTTTVGSLANTLRGDGTTNPVLTLTGTSLAKESLLINCTTPVANCFGVQLGGTNKFFVDTNGFTNFNANTVIALNGATYRGSAAGSIDYTAGTDGTADETSSTASFRGSKMSNSNANNAGAALFAGGDLTASGAATGASGAATVRGGDCAGTGACTAGTLTLRPGIQSNAAPSASAVRGKMVFAPAALKKGTTVTAGNLACITADNTANDCLTAGGNPLFVGVQAGATGGTALVQTEGVVTLNLDASSTFTANDIVCASATGAALSHMNGTSACSGRRVGFAVAGATSSSTVVAILSIN